MRTAGSLLGKLARRDRTEELADRDSSSTAPIIEKAVGSGRWATRIVDSVAIGIYAKEALTKLGLWATAEPKLAQTDNVRAALLLVSSGESPLSIVYETDANADPNVKVVAPFHETSHKLSSTHSC